MIKENEIYLDQRLGKLPPFFFSKKKLLNILISQKSIYLTLPNIYNEDF